MVIALILCVILGGILFWMKYGSGRENIWKKQNVYQVDVWKVVSFWDRILQKISFPEFDAKLYKAAGDEPYYGYVEFGKSILALKDLDLVKQILIKDFDHFTDRVLLDLNPSDTYQKRMLTNISGKEWKDLRSAISPTFTSGKIRRMFAHFKTCSDSLNSYLKSKLDQGTNVVNFHDSFGRYTLAAISLIAFGQPSDAFEDKSVFRDMAHRFAEPTKLLITKMFLWLFVPKVAKLLRVSVQEPESTEFFRKIIERNIAKRRAQGDSVKYNDFLQLLLEAQVGKLEPDEISSAQNPHSGVADGRGGHVIDDDTIVAQSILFFIAGTDTLQSSLTFTAYELALNQEVQDKLATEVTATLQKNNGELTYEGLSEMPFLDAVVSETLRLHPPGFGTIRDCTKDYILPGTKIRIPKGTRVSIPIRQFHHDPKHFPNPMNFNTDNFSPENKSKRHPYAFLPFGEGPRNCIAMRFALIEAKAAIAHLVSSYKLETCEKTEIPLKEVTGMTATTAANGLFLKFSPRTL